MFLLFAIVWYVVGVIVTINEMRYDFDVTVNCIIGAFIIGLIGPIIFLKTLYRVRFFDCFNRVIFRKI